ncbi:MAG: tetratricopeptide repeat protein, partial [Verrucomicrobiota bacterium]|nr:tetratricopeptide repeat protein [Verrucomicrobiota bacterium]
HTLDRALADFRKAIDKAATSSQASYPAFQAAKVYKLEFKWQEIIDLMNYYMDRWEEQADVAESMFWIGQSQIELGQVAEAVAAYLDAIERFGNDPTQQGIDKIILELVKIADYHLSEEDREGLAVKLKLKLTSVDERLEVLRLRLQVAQSLLQGDDVAAALGAELLDSDFNLKLASPVSLSLMCDAAVDTGNVEQMKRLYEYFVKSYEESDMLWHAYRAQTYRLLAEEDHWGVLASIDEVQGMFGADAFMGWAQIIKADTQFKMEKYEESEASYNMCMGVPEWRGPIFAESMYGMGQCRLARGELETAHSFFQRTYLLFKGYSDGDWAAKGYLAAADTLIKLGREEDAINTLKAMLEDDYTNANPLADQVRQQLKKYGGQ